MLKTRVIQLQMTEVQTAFCESQNEDGSIRVSDFRAEKRSAQVSAHPLSQAQGGLFCDCVVCH